MAGYFEPGEQKVRPGAYFNVNKNGDEDNFGAIDGIVAVLFRANFGPLGTVTPISKEDGYETIYGTGETTDALREAFNGGARTIIACRVGHNGECGSVTLKGHSQGQSGGDPAIDVAKLTALYPGDRAFTVSVRECLDNPLQKELTLYDGTTELESVRWDKSQTDVAGLKDALKNSNYVSIEIKVSNAAVDVVSQQKFTPGTNPEVINADYSNALSEVEKYFFNAICVDTEDKAVHELVSAFLDRIYNAGQFAVGFVAEKSSTELQTRMNTAASYDKENMVYILNPHVMAKDVELDGYQTAAIIAGLYAATPANQSLTHMVVRRISELKERLTNTQITKAEQNGCLVFAYSSDDQIWIDYGINTLIHPADNKDSGWKKLRRVKTRYELLYRANAQADALVGKVDNDKNGRATIAAKLQKICNDMVTSEGKLIQATVEESSTYISDGDTCYFDIDVVDKDSADHIYLFYRFQFSTNVTTETEE